MKFLTLLIFAMLTPLFAVEGFQVIVHADNATTSLSKSQLSKIFLKKQTQWDDGSSIEPVEQGAEATIRERFSLLVHRRPVNVLKKYWLKQAFSGANTEPPEKASDADVLAFVANQKGAIGYVSDDTKLPSTVKVVSIND